MTALETRLKTLADDNSWREEEKETKKERRGEMQTQGESRGDAGRARVHHFK